MKTIPRASTNQMGAPAINPAPRSKSVASPSIRPSCRGDSAPPARWNRRPRAGIITLNQMSVVERRLAQTEPAARRGKPLLTIATVAAQTGPDCGARHVNHAIEDGRIVWAWRISAGKSARAETRILRHSAEHYVKTLGRTPEPEITWVQVLAIVLPVGEAFPCSRLMCWWSATAALGRDLIIEGSLRAVGDASARPGRGGSQLVTRASAIEFLRARRIL